MDGRLLELCDEAGHVVARGRLGAALTGDRYTLWLDEGASTLRQRFFLDGLRGVACRAESLCFEGRLATRWEANRRMWTLTVPPGVMVSTAALRKAVAA